MYKTNVFIINIISYRLLKSIEVKLGVGGYMLVKWIKALTRLYFYITKSISWSKNLQTVVTFPVTKEISKIILKFNSI